MNHANIKVGEPYTVRVKIKKNALAENDEFFAVAVDSSGNELNADGAFFTSCELPAFSPITPSEPPTLVGPTPKHNPCRKFRKGDKVRLIEWNGRNPFDTHHGLKLNPGEVHIVLDDEYERNEVYIGMSAADEEQSVVHSCNLELITPVEELEPYLVEKSNDGATIVWTVKKRDCSQGLDFRYCPGLGGNIFFSENHCRKHAEAERDRLNEEYRKEQK